MAAPCSLPSRPGPVTIRRLPVPAPVDTVPARLDAVRPGRHGSLVWVFAVLSDDQKVGRVDATTSATSPRGRELAAALLRRPLSVDEDIPWECLPGRACQLQLRFETRRGAPWTSIVGALPLAPRNAVIWPVVA